MRFCQITSSPLPVQVMLYLRLEEMPQRDRGVVQGGQQISPDVVDLRGILPHPVQHILHVVAFQSPEAVLYRRGGDLFTTYADSWAGAAGVSDSTG